MRKKVAVVFGTRPEVLKTILFIEALRRYRDIEVREEVDVPGAGDVVSKSGVIGVAGHGGRRFAGVGGRCKPGWLDCRKRHYQTPAFGYAAGG